MPVRLGPDNEGLLCDIGDKFGSTGTFCGIGCGMLGAISGRFG